MAKLDQRRINFVKSLSVDVKAKVLYEFLKKGTSNRNIERLIDELKEEDGWQAWSVLHFYGFNKHSKSKYPSLTLKSLKERLETLSDDELEDFHLNMESKDDDSVNVVMGENDGKDIFRTIKTRQGQHKLRKLLLRNYKSKCALCNISHPSLLITSHIKPWAESSAEERVDPCNGILLCVLHDALFDKGFISFDDNYHVIFSSEVDFEDQGISKELISDEPVKDAPSPEYLKEHRMKYGYE